MSAAQGSTITTVLRHEARAVLKNRGVLLFGGGILLLTETMLRLTGSGPRALSSLLGVVLLVVPLVTMLFGVITWHASREFNELLLAQPIRRTALFSGLYLGLVLPLATAFALGLLLPFALHRALGRDALPLLAATLAGGVALTFVFAGLALLIGVAIEDRLRGVGTAIAVWMLLTIGYDGLMLLVATTFTDYPLEKPMLALTLANPVDLARTMIVMQSDAAALMGYTGALMHRFLGSMLGSMAAIVGLLLWILAPAWAGRRAFERRDF
ncbi:ABC transporter permease subunit [Gemmatimonas sp.]|uniref:ABC transporter permease subunit n=1 Tax=Gemmatimonas sp. TaxID=1962908 RepID=UPI00398365E5